MILQRMAKNSLSNQISSYEFTKTTTFSCNGACTGDSLFRVNIETIRKNIVISSAQRDDFGIYNFQCM